MLSAIVRLEAKTALSLMTAELLALDDRMGKELAGGRTLDDDTAGQIMLATKDKP